MNKILVMFVGSLLFGLACAKENSAIISTVLGNKSGGLELAFDFVNQEKVAGLQFDVQIPEGIPSKAVNIEKCVAGLPESVEARCGFVDGMIRVLVFTMPTAELPTGNIGSVTIDTFMKTGVKPEDFRVLNVHMPNVNGKEVDADVLVNIE